MENLDKGIQTAYDMIQDGMVVSLGGGSNVEKLARMLKEKPKEISVTTPSSKIKKIIRECGFKLIDARFLDHVDLAFDGCDEIDENLACLKSTGGIHTREKILADMADEYVILTDVSKYDKKLRFKHSICLEVLQPALSSVIKKLRKAGFEVSVRENTEKGSLEISQDGNYIVDIKMEPYDNLQALNRYLNNMPGIVEHSLFYNMVDKAIIRDKDGSVKVLTKPVKIQSGNASTAETAGTDTASSAAASSGTARTTGIIDTASTPQTEQTAAPSIKTAPAKPEVSVDAPRNSGVTLSVQTI